MPEEKEAFMQGEMEQCRADTLALCNRLLTALENNRDDARAFFAGEVHQAYDSATEKAENKVRQIRNKLRSL